MRIAGVDEAGRGALAGPVVAAAVILTKPIKGLKDSKQLTRKQREELAEQIFLHCEVGIGLATEEEIDILNIREATILAIKRALEKIKPEKALIDGLHLPVPIPYENIPRGDQLVPEISAASIIAKVIRDRIMTQYDRFMKRFCNECRYDFARHVGYPTPLHLERLKKYGPTLKHRLTFGPVSKLVTLEMLESWLEKGMSQKRYQAVLRHLPRRLDRTLSMF